MAFYDVNAAIEKPNMLNSFRQGQQYGQQLREQKQQAQDQNALRTLAPQVIEGDPGAYAQAAAINPERAQAMQGAGDSQLRRLKGAIDYIEKATASGNPQAAEAAYQQVRPYLNRNSPDGIEPPMTLAEAMPKMLEAKARIAMLDPTAGGDAIQSQKISDDGYIVNTYRSGRMEKTGQKVDRQAWFRDQEGLPPTIVNKDGSIIIPGGGAPGPAAVVAPAQTQFTGPDGMPINIGNDIDPAVRAAILADPAGLAAAPDGSTATLPPVDRQPSTAGGGLQARPAISPAEAQRLQIAQEANQRAAEASQRAAAAAQNAERGNAPAGFRFKPDGSLEPIPGGPKPAGAVASEDERKAAAWLAQSRNAYQNMLNVIGQDPAAAEPGFLETYVPNDELANRSRSDTRQQYVQAASSLSEALLRAATGAGVNRDEAVQKIRELTPQRGDSEAVRQQKLAAIPVYLDALEARAGRAAPGVQAGPAAVASVQRARNPQTGEVLVLRNGQWVPE